MKEEKKKRRNEFRLEQVLGYSSPSCSNRHNCLERHGREALQCRKATNWREHTPANYVEWNVKRCTILKRERPCKLVCPTESTIIVELGDIPIVPVDSPTVVREKRRELWAYS